MIIFLAADGGWAPAANFTLLLDGEIRHLVLFDCELFNEICDRIKDLISEKSGITDTTDHNLREIRIYSYNSLPFKNILTFHSVLIRIKSLVNKNKNECYYIFRKRFI